MTEFGKRSKQWAFYPKGHSGSIQTRAEFDVGVQTQLAVERGPSKFPCSLGNQKNKAIGVLGGLESTSNIGQKRGDAIRKLESCLGIVSRQIQYAPFMQAACGEIQSPGSSQEHSENCARSRERSDQADCVTSNLEWPQRRTRNEHRWASRLTSPQSNHQVRNEGVLEIEKGRFRGVEPMSWVRTSKKKQQHERTPNTMVSNLLAMASNLLAMVLGFLLSNPRISQSPS